MSKLVPKALQALGASWGPLGVVDGSQVGASRRAVDLAGRRDSLQGQRVSDLAGPTHEGWLPASNYGQEGPMGDLSLCTDLDRSTSTQVKCGVRAPLSQPSLPDPNSSQVVWGPLIAGCQVSNLQPSTHPCAGAVAHPSRRPLPPLPVGRGRHTVAGSGLTAYRYLMLVGLWWPHGRPERGVGDQLDAAPQWPARGGSSGPSTNPNGYLTHRQRQRHLTRPLDGWSHSSG